MNIIPRPRTRRRAVYDALKNANGTALRRRDLWTAYWQVEPHARSTLGLSTALKLYAKRTGRGMYAAQDWVLGEVQKLEEMPIMEEALVEVVRKGEPPPNAAKPANVDPPAPKAEAKAEAKPPEPMIEVKRAPDEPYRIGDLLRFIDESGRGHPQTVTGHVYKVLGIEPKNQWAKDYMVDAEDTDGSMQYVRCYSRRFEFVKAGGQAVVEPPKRKFYKGERIAYVGGYGYLDTRGYKVGDLFTVKFYGDADGKENAEGEYLFLEETPATDGHMETSFRFWPVADEEIKCHCGAVSFGRARDNVPFPHLIREWRTGYRKADYDKDAGLHFLDKPCQLKNGLVAYKNLIIEDLRNKLEQYQATLKDFEQQSQEMQKGIAEALKNLNETGKNLPNPKR